MYKYHFFSAVQTYLFILIEFLNVYFGACIYFLYFIPSRPAHIESLAQLAQVCPFPHTLT